MPANRLRKAAQIIPILFLAGCATTKEPVPERVTNPNYSSDALSQNIAWKADFAACRILHNGDQGRRQCMKQKGWPLQ